MQHYMIKHCIECPFFWSGYQVFRKAGEGQDKEGVWGWGECPLLAVDWGTHPPPLKHWDPPGPDDLPEPAQYGHEVYLLWWQVVMAT